MNVTERKQLGKINEKLSDYLAEVQAISDEIEERASNMEEYFPGSEKAEKLQGQADALATAIEGIEDTIENIDESMEA